MGVFSGVGAGIAGAVEGTQKTTNADGTTGGR
jgi:hypothetical protein